MEWEAVLVGMLTSGALVGIFSYIIRQSFVRTLDHRMKKLEAQNKALIDEAIRRQANVHDEQREPLKAISSLSYRLRNTLRDLISCAKSQETADQRKLLDRYHTLYGALEEILYEERAILPENVFRATHSLKTTLQAVDVGLGTLECFHRDNPSPEDDSHRETLAHCQQDLLRLYGEIDTKYLHIVQEAQRILGVRLTTNEEPPASNAVYP